MKNIEFVPSNLKAALPFFYVAKKNLQNNEIFVPTN